MEPIDNAKVARVWQRVKAEAPPPPAAVRPEQGILELIAGEWADAATYSRLSRHYRGHQRNRLQKMAAQAHSKVACLKGLYTLMTGALPTVRSNPPAALPTEQALRHCYTRESHRLARYTHRSNDPAYGQVFARLAEQSRQHCRLIPELLGNLGKKK